MTKQQYHDDYLECCHWIKPVATLVQIEELYASAHNVKGFICQGCGAVGTLNIDPDEISWERGSP